MITTLGYEELKRLHEERLARSLRRHATAVAAEEASARAAANPATAVEPCMVIELPERAEPSHKLGA